MSEYATLLKDSVLTGAVASLATTVAVAVGGSLEDQGATAPVNAISHIAWGDEAAAHDEASWKYTAVGLVLNTAAVTSWAAIYELLYGRVADREDLAGTLIGGATVSTIAYLTDYHIVPQRFTPGFEKRLSNRALLGVYATLALSLSLGSLARAKLSRKS